MTIEKFNEQKAKFHEQEKAVLAIQAEIDKTKNILEALENEKGEFVAQHKEKLATSGTLSADEYVELKNKNSGLSARIEYYNAVLVDLEKSEYNAKELLFGEQWALKNIRISIFEQKVESLLYELFHDNAEKWENIIGYLNYLPQFQAGNFPNGGWKYGNKTVDEVLKEYLLNRISVLLPKNGKIDDEWKIETAQLKDFTPISPTKRHAESFKAQSHQPQGLSDLINAL